MGFSRGINYRGSQGLKRVATKHKDHAHRLRAKKAHLTSGFAKHLDSLRSSSRKLLKKLKGAKIEPEEPLEPSFDEATGKLGIHWYNPDGSVLAFHDDYW